MWVRGVKSRKTRQRRAVNPHKDSQQCVSPCSCQASVCAGGRGFANLKVCMRSRVLCVSMAIYHHAAAEEVSRLITHQLPFHPNEQALNGQKEGDWESVQPPAPVDLDDDTNNNNNGKGKRAREYPEPLFTLRRLTGPTGRSSYEFRQHLSVLLARPPTPQPLQLCTPGGRRLYFLARTDPILLVFVIFP